VRQICKRPGKFHRDYFRRWNLAPVKTFQILQMKVFEAGKIAMKFIYDNSPVTFGA
jgi:hypothetical protein